MTGHRLIAAARAAPAPLAWKRRGFSAARPRWLDRVSEVLGGRACVSRIRIDVPLPPACAVSSPSRQATRPCAASWKVMAMRSGSTQTEKP